MTAIFFKELRENARWAVLIAVVFSGFLFLRAWHASPFYLLDLPDPMTLLFAPFAGLAMGFAQSAFETRPDNWAFVVHRPVPRAGIFAAKSAAGLLLRYAGLGLACLLAILWATHPGNLPMPFQGRMVLPLVADTLTAGCYYFVGVLLTLRRARWLGTRLLPVGLAFLCSVAVRLTPEFWQAVAFISAVQCVGAVAAWDAFATGGTVERGGVPRVAHALMVYFGALTIGFMSSGIPALLETTVTWRDVRMTPQGNVVHTTKVFRDDELTYSVTDVNGKPLAEFEGLNLDDPANADRFVRFVPVIADDRRLPWPMSTMVGGGYRSARPGVRALRTFGRPGARLASPPLLDVKERLIDLYDPITCRLIGRVGPAGFSPGAAEPVERFPDELLGGMTQASTRTLAFTSAVYWMELDQRGVRKLFTASPQDPVVGAHELPPQDNPTILIATRTYFYLLDPTGKMLTAIPSNVDLVHCDVRGALLADNHHLVLHTEAMFPDLANQFPSQFLEYSRDGKLLRTTTAPQVDQSNRITQARTAIFAVFHPVAGVPLHRAWLVDEVFQLDSQNHPRLFYLSVIIGGLLAALATFILGRRYGFTMHQRLAWTAINLLIGPAGVVVMAAIYQWPAREICPACQSTRFSGLRECSSCGAQLAPADSDGREIFEPVDAFAANALA
jgi:hypothetical protein